MIQLRLPHLRGLRALVLLVLVPLAGCSAWQAGAEPRSVEASPDYDGDSRALASIDDVTNGLVNNASQGVSAGAFFNDGGDGDIRGRTQNYFSDPGAWRTDATKASGSSERAPKEPAETRPRTDRMLIYSGQVRVEVARAEEAAKAFLEQIEAWGGYLQKQSSTSLTVRVPAKHFDEAFAAVRDAGRVLSESRQANDVTEEFVDVGIRVDNARRSRERLLEVLKLAEKVEDILRVEKELSRLTQEIERLEGRLKFLRDQVSMSTLRAEFQAVAKAPPLKKQRRRSRFRWVNRVGATSVMGGF